jgi:hypothetical protein
LYSRISKSPKVRSTVNSCLWVILKSYSD